MVEFAAREVSDSERITARMQNVADLLKEADYWARPRARSIVTEAHIDQAIEAQIYRSDRVNERMQEAMLRETILIDTEGEAVGQINGLVGLSSSATSRSASRLASPPPCAWARRGGGHRARGGVGRAASLQGRADSVQLPAWPAMRATCPLSLSASLVFEQSYGGVDGDSASSAELYALLSAIAGVPIAPVVGGHRLGQPERAQVQAIGGVNEKIEGFFDLCQARGLTGDQGVLIPAANVKHLMLRRDVVEAAEAGQFHVYAVDTIDQGIEILTGVPAGERDEDGRYAEGSINRMVEDRLAEFAEKRRAFSKQDDDGADGGSNAGL